MNGEEKINSAPILILHGSQQPYLSIGRHYGGINAFGAEYLYLPNEDAFLRRDYVKRYAKHKKRELSWDDFLEFVKNEKA